MCRNFLEHAYDRIGPLSLYLPYAYTQRVAGVRIAGIRIVDEHRAIAMKEGNVGNEGCPLGIKTPGSHDGYAFL
jgi:hypothetical protein